MIDPLDPIHISRCTTSVNCKLGGVDNQCTLVQNSQRTQCHACTLGFSLDIADTSSCLSSCDDGILISMNTVPQNMCMPKQSLCNFSFQNTIFPPTKLTKTGSTYYSNIVDFNLPSVCRCDNGIDEDTYKKSPGVNMIYCVQGNTHCGPGAYLVIVSTPPILTRKCVSCMQNCKQIILPAINH